jgi:hypothetical protein
MEANSKIVGKLNNFHRGLMRMTFCLRLGHAVGLQHVQELTTAVKVKT